MTSPRPGWIDLRPIATLLLCLAIIPSARTNADTTLRARPASVPWTAQHPGMPASFAAPTPDDSTIGDLAALLGGQACGTGSRWGWVMKDTAWMAYRRVMRRMHSGFEKRHAAPLRSFAARDLPHTSAATGAVFYPFSGPDIAFPLILFPNTPLIVMLALEPVGGVPGLSAEEPDSVRPNFAALEESIDDILSTGFFTTSRMKTEFRSGDWKGVIPPLLALLTLGGQQVVGLELIGIGADGLLLRGDERRGSRVPGVEIHFQSGDGRSVRRLQYFSMDAGNGTMTRRPEFTTYITSLAPEVAYVKSASYLLHSDGFSMMRDLVLTAQRIVQDDTGVPLRFLDSGTWTVDVFGTYVTPISPFQGRVQSDLKALFDQKRPGALPFAYGYHWTRGRAHIMVATRRGGQR